jgi:hypothetical protein
MGRFLVLGGRASFQRHFNEFANKNCMAGRKSWLAIGEAGWRSGRVAPGLTPWRSHRSGRAQLRHPVRQRAGWLRGRQTSAEAGRAPRTLSGEVTVTGYEATKCSPWCPSPSPPVAAPFPALGPSRRVPQLQRYYGAVRLPVPLSPRFVAFAWRYPAVCLWFRSRRSRTPNRGPGVRNPVPTSGHCRREATRASQVPGQPTVPLPCSSTPAGPNTPGHCDVSAWPPL